MSACPYCRADLPAPPERFCLNCGGDLESLPPPEGGVAEQPEAGSPVLAPEPPAGPDTSGVEGVPWERKRELGLATALVESTGQVLLSPGQFFSKMAGSEGMGSLLAYAVVVGWAALLVDTFYLFIFQLIAGSRALPAWVGGGEMEKLFPWAAGPAGLATRLLLGPFALAVVTLLRAGIFHLCLLVVGGAGRGFQITLGVVAYATAADLLALLPLCGGLAGVIYGLILTAIGLAHAHRISGGKAATAVLLPVMLACCGCAALLILFGGSVVSLLQGLD